MRKEKIKEWRGKKGGVEPEKTGRSIKRRDFELACRQQIWRGGKGLQDSIQLTIERGVRARQQCGSTESRSRKKVLVDHLTEQGLSLK